MNFINNNNNNKKKINNQIKSKYIINILTNKKISTNKK